MKGEHLRLVLAWEGRTLDAFGYGMAQEAPPERSRIDLIAQLRRDTYRGYNGYMLSREGKKIIFGGDTAKTDSFRPLRSKGPFEVAIMPIGSYKPFECSHCTPEQSVRMTNDAGAKYLLPIHHKTFKLGREGQAEPLRRLEMALEPERIALRDVGQTFFAS
jgi:L-ascorbate metabolism protein UlaG (beta-lactamase superfamily)